MAEWHENKRPARSQHLVDDTHMLKKKALKPANLISISAKKACLQKQYYLKSNDLMWGFILKIHLIIFSWLAASCTSFLFDSSYVKALLMIQRDFSLELVKDIDFFQIQRG